MKAPLPHKLRTGSDANSFKHGFATHGRVSPEYRTWAGMRSRCLNNRNPKFPDYGGRGITVCARWNDFEAFLFDMGNRPSKSHSIERKDVDGNYEPSNCKWATAAEQSNNKRCNRMIEINGVIKNATQWSKEFGIKSKTVLQRIYYGWNPVDAVTKPLFPR